MWSRLNVYDSYLKTISVWCLRLTEAVNTLLPCGIVIVHVFT